VAGRRLSGVAGGQPRIVNVDKGTITNYLEGENITTADDLFSKTASSATLNDHALFH